MRLPLILLLITLTPLLFAQNWTVEDVGKLPFATSNNAVALAYHDGQPTIYSFTGIDTSLKYTGIHLKAGAVNLTTGVSTEYADVPDTLGKIAAGASTLHNKIFVMGGYHVYADGSELSSNKVHCFDVEKGIWEADRSPLPVATDDHVQAIWQDSLIYVITGWSDSKNIPDVQIYNPSTDTWTAGTPVPDNNRYNAFGASGTIIGNTIYYLGGASMGTNFPITFRLRIGQIDPDNPSDIIWRDSLLSPTDKYYRSGCTDISGYPTWLGGSTISYNYNALSYSDNTIVHPSNQTILLASEAIVRVTKEHLPMDLRGIGNLSSTVKILAGGIYEDRQVSDKVVQLTWGFPLGIDKRLSKLITLYPNPTNGVLHLSEKKLLKIYSPSGQLMFSGNTDTVQTDKWSPGVYSLYITHKHHISVEKLIVI